MSAKRVNLHQVVSSLPEVAKGLNLERLRPAGSWIEADLPDTLDLADRANLVINALTNLRSHDSYASTSSFTLSDPPRVGPPNWEIVPKYLRALPLVRTMSGSDQNLDIEFRAMEAMLRQVGTDGQVYCPIAGDGPAQDTSHAITGAVLFQALLNWHERDQHPSWLDWARIVGDGLKLNLVKADGYAYIPPECSLSPAGQWIWTLRGGGNAPGYIPYAVPSEPVHDSQGQEGCVKFYQSQSICSLTLYWSKLGDRLALEQAQKLVRFCRKPELWSQDTEDEATPPHEHGVFTGHFHGNLTAMIGLLTYATAVGDQALKESVREAYDHARRHGIVRWGYMPGWIKPLVGRDRFWHLNQNEGCGVADLLMLGVRLSDARLGDYWDDVDMVVRNHFIELQATELDLMRRAVGGTSRHDDVLRGFVGGFSQASLTGNLSGVINGCCTANAARALYQVWEAIVRFDAHAGTAVVNLILNRVSPWLDIMSYLPYEGRVEIVNKQARSIALRIPGWVNPGSVVCFVRDESVTPLLVGSYMILTGLAPGDVTRCEFPVPETVDRYQIAGQAYSVRLRGSTILDVTPRDTDRPEHRVKYPFFRRQQMIGGRPPQVRVRRFIPERILPCD